MNPRLHLRLLGPLEVELNNEPVVFRYDKLRALLAYLAVEARRPHPREALVGLLWPDVPDADARRNLSQALFNLRQTLGQGTAVPAPAAPFLLANRETLQFNHDSDHQLDVAEFEALLADCDTHTHARLAACPECAARLERAVALYRGDFLQHFFLPDSAGFEDWALLKREDLRRRALKALAALTAFFEQQAGYELAIQYARRQLALEPWREEAHRDLMRLLALSGQRSAALAQYEAARKALADELGVPPSPETEGLLAQIKAGELRPSTPSTAPGVTPTAPAPPSASLPTPLTAFVGRERELAEIGRLLADPGCRLLTLTGPGGIGKTRLAIQTAGLNRATFAQGAVWVPLAPVHNPGQIPNAVADALSMSLDGGADPVEQLAHSLRGQSLLLVLDNFEHLLAAGGSPTWLNDLLRGAPGLRLLATSREALNLQGEWVFPVEGLGDKAVDLFVQSARRARAGFELAPADAAAVSRICELVGATPLAIELAAAWVRVLSCTEIAQEIERSFASGQALDFLSTPVADVPEGHRSMAAVFDHSWRLLSHEERAALGRLSVFQGGFSRPAAEQVAGASLAVLSALNAKSLLRRVSSGRYDLHELVRQYAGERLAQAPQALQQAHAAHMAFYSRFVSERADDLRGQRQREAGQEIAGELDNVNAAWEWAIAQRHLDGLRQMALPIYLFAQRRSRYREGVEHLAQAIATVQDDPSPEAQEALAGFLLSRGWLRIRLGQLDGAAADLLRSDALFTRLRRLPAHRLIGDPVMGLGLIASIRGDYAAATRHYEEALEVVAQHGDHQALAYPHLYLSSIQRALGNYAAAERYVQQARTLAKTADQPWLLGYVANELGQVALARGELAEAQTHFETAFGLREKLDDVSGMALDLCHLGHVALARHEHAEAERLFQRGLALYSDIGDQGGLVTALHGLGRNALAGGHLAAAWGYLTQALETANRASFTPVCLSLLASLAEVLEAHGALERARHLAAVIVSQPNYDHATRVRANQLIERHGTAPAGDLPGAIAAVLATPL